MSDQRERMAKMLRSLATVDGRVTLVGLTSDGEITTTIGLTSLEWAVADALYQEGVRIVDPDEMSPCPWCGHLLMCHKGPEGECVQEARDEEPDHKVGGYDRDGMANIMQSLKR